MDRRKTRTGLVQFHQSKKTAFSRQEVGDHLDNLIHRCRSSGETFSCIAISVVSVTDMSQTRKPTIRDLAMVIPLLSRWFRAMIRASDTIGSMGSLNPNCLFIILPQTGMSEVDPIFQRLTECVAGIRVERENQPLIPEIVMSHTTHDPGLDLGASRYISRAIATHRKEIQRGTNHQSL